MKKNYIFSSLFILAIFMSINLSSKSVFAQAPLLVEDFPYAAGALLVENGWTAHSGAGTNSLVTAAPGLTFSGYPSSGVGNAVPMVLSGEDVNRAFAVQTSGSVYAGFLVRVTEASADPAGGYFFHLGPDPIGTTFRGRVFIKKDASNNVSFGISKAGTSAATVAFTPFTYALNTTYLVVVKYTIVAGVDNDTVDLFVSTTTPATEPAATISAIDATATDVNPGTVALRQGATATSPTVTVDGIRVGTTWASVVSASTAPTQNVVDFDGDGKTDLAVIRNTGGGPNGQLTWFINNSSNGSTSAFAWGLNGDVYVPADYDGDDKTDIAVWREGAANVAAFYILQSNGFTLRIETFGQTGDNPKVVGDYDGDGRDDVAVYRSGANAGQQSTWYYRGSLNNPSGNITFVPWGQNGDFTAPGDYDGDGKNDFVIQRNGGSGQANFWTLSSTGSTSVTAFGTPVDLVVPGDYDGDGKTDIATARGVAGAIQWQYLSSQNATVNFATFGTSATDFPTPGDYDGDGKSDFAIWRPSASAGASVFWYLGSTSGAVGAPFGSNGDYPVANTFTF